MADTKKGSELYEKILKEISKAIIGKGEIKEALVLALVAGGHVLIEGLPGTAKTKLARSFAEAIGGKFKRIQFTPDMLPGDITGFYVYATGGNSRFIEGPIFANIVLADELNRTTPRTQSALLEAMQEYQVTAGGKKHDLDLPFFVLATQNPIEQEGTYPLPEAQLDRFMFNIFVDYPSPEEEMDIMRLTTTIQDLQLKKVLSGEDIISIQEIVRKVPIADHVIEYAMNIVRATRLTKPEAPEFIKEWLSWGAGPRATQYLILGGKARALLYGRHYVSCDDVASVSHPVLRHRLITNFNAEAEGITTDIITDRLLEHVPKS